MRNTTRRRSPTVSLLAALSLMALAALVVTGTLGGLGSTSRALAQGAGEPTAQTDDAIPARNVTMIGSSPAEGANETWGIGEVGSEDTPSFAIVRYSSDGGWTLAPAPL